MSYLLLIFVYGELDFRIIPHESRLEYDVDENLYSRLRPNQVGFVWLAQMTQKSPPITINSLRLRGPEVDVNAPERYRILATGSSYALGSGVRDDETWTLQLQALLRARHLPADVLNAGSSSWGPFQHAAFVELYAPHYNPHVLMVMVTEANANFQPITNGARKQAFLEESHQRQKLLSFSPFLAFALRKIDFLYQRHWDKPQNYMSSFQTEKVPRTPKERLAFILQHQGQYWQKIADCAASRAIPTLFFVLNAEGSTVGLGLTEYLKKIEASNTWIKVVAITPKDLPPHDGLSPDAYVQKHLSILGDGHPNPLYHRLMAEKLAEVFKTWPTSDFQQAANIKFK